MHYQDETHGETNPSLYKVWHRRGVQPTIPAAGTNRRLTVFGSVEARGRGRVEVICPAQDSACFARYLAALDARHVATGKEVYLVLDNGPCHTSKTTKAALAARSAWLHVLWLAPYSPQLNPKEREWTRLKRDARSHLAPTLRSFVDEIAAGRRHLGGDRLNVVDQVPDWFIAGHRKEPHRSPGGTTYGGHGFLQAGTLPHEDERVTGGCAVALSCLTRIYQHLLSGGAAIQRTGRVDRTLDSTTACSYVRQGDR